MAAALVRITMLEVLAVVEQALLVVVAMVVYAAVVVAVAVLPIQQGPEVPPLEEALVGRQVPLGLQQ